jgi:hypothetical protein
MHHKILKHLLTLFFVLVLLSVPGMQWMVMENTSKPEKDQKEVLKQSRPEIPAQKNPLRKDLEINIY